MKNLLFLEETRELLTDWEVFYPKGGEEGYFTNYSWYHLMWLAIMIITTILLCLKLATKHNKRIDNYVVFSIGAFLFIIEIYKQVFYALVYGCYQWDYFPFQFCSVPMYIALIAPFLKEGKLQSIMFKFLAFYGLLAGVSVMSYPSTCFCTNYLTMLIHTMAWHSSMVVLGVYLIVSKGYCNSIKDFVKEIVYGSFILMGLIGIAVSANILGQKFYFGTPRNIHEFSFAMMYISPYYSCPLPVLGSIKETIPFPVFLLLYIIAFMLGVSLLWMIVYGIKKLVFFIQNQLKIKKNTSEVTQ